MVTGVGVDLAAHADKLARGEATPRRLPPHIVEASSAYYAVESPAIDDTSGPGRLYRLLEAAVAGALADAELDGAERRRLGIFLGSSSLDVPLLEAEYARQLASGRDPIPLADCDPGMLTAWLAERFGLHGGQYTFNTACSSSANALAQGMRMIQCGAARHALVVGSEAFSRLCVTGFEALMLTSADVMRPFDRHRDGLLLGEGVGAVVLGAERPEASAMRLAGAASLCDTSSATNSQPQRIARVMQQALDAAGVAPREVAAIKAHGTGTLSNDLAEGHGMRLVFGDGLPPFTSVKPYIGHTMGACGVLELLCIKACVEAGFFPGTPGFQDPDPELDLAPVTSPVAVGAGHYLLNFFGFGGNNASLLLSIDA